MLDPELRTLPVYFMMLSRPSLEMGTISIPIAPHEKGTFQETFPNSPGLGKKSRQKWERTRSLCKPVPYNVLLR